VRVLKKRVKRKRKRKTVLEKKEYNSKISTTGVKLSHGY